MAAQTTSDKGTSEKKQSRELRDLKAQGQSAMLWGLPNPASEAAVLGIGLLMHEKLADKADPARATAAADIAAKLLDKTTSRMTQASDFACSAGCSFCCHSAVAASAPEVFRVARALAQSKSATPAASPTAVIERCQARAWLSLQALLATSHACPLLVDNTCIVHEDRPLGCRQYFSTSVDACRLHFEGRTQGSPNVPAAANIGLIVRSLLVSAERALGLRAELYELSSAIAIALETPDAEARWLAGEDVLAKATKMPQPPNMKTAVERWSDMIVKMQD